MGCKRKDTILNAGLTDKNTILKCWEWDVSSLWRTRNLALIRKKLKPFPIWKQKRLHLESKEKQHNFIPQKWRKLYCLNKISWTNQKNVWHTPNEKWWKSGQAYLFTVNYPHLLFYFYVAVIFNRANKRVKMDLDFKRLENTLLTAAVSLLLVCWILDGIHIT